MTQRAESDQLPEENPAEQAVDDAPGDVREGARTSAGGASHERRSTGQPTDSDAREGERGSS